MNIYRLAEISRPRIWLYLAAPYAIGYAAATTSAAQFYTFGFWYTLFYFLIPANFFLYGISSYFDRMVDIYNPKKKQYESPAQKHEMKVILNFVLISLIFTLPLFSYLERYPISVLFCFLLLSAFYSAPPIRFKTIPFLDAASNMLYVLPGILGFTQLTNRPPAISMVIALTCWAAGVYLFSKISRRVSDRRVRISTSATYLGRTRSLYACAGLWLFFAIYMTSLNPLFSIAFLYPAIPIYILLREPEDMDSIHRRFTLMNAELMAALFFYLLISKFYS